MPSPRTGPTPALMHLKMKNSFYSAALSHSVSAGKFPDVYTPANYQSDESQVCISSHVISP